MPDISIKTKIERMIRIAANDPQARGVVLHRHAVEAGIGTDRDQVYEFVPINQVEPASTLPEDLQDD
ncbi:MAG: hypothetical protein DDT26_00226 [Dehalococcoidia bacterium]|nr:hypothetical protein [Chloroflexota bacterium]